MKRAALFIGINRYEDPDINKLDWAENDAMELYAFFKRSLGYDEVRSILNPDSEVMLDAVQEMQRGLSSGDLLVIFFAGHGIEHDGKHLLLFPKTMHKRVRFLQQTIPLDLLKQETEKEGLNRIFMLDTCRTDLLRGARGAELEATRDVQCIKNVTSNMQTKGALGILCSCDQGQRSRETSKFKQGLFSLALLQVMEDAFRQAKPIEISSDLEKQLVVRISQLEDELNIPTHQQPWFLKTGELPPVYCPDRVDENDASNKEGNEESTASTNVPPGKPKNETLERYPLASDSVTRQGVEPRHTSITNEKQKEPKQVRSSPQLIKLLLVLSIIVILGGIAWQYSHWITEKREASVNLEIDSTLPEVLNRNNEAALAEDISLVIPGSDQVQIKLKLIPAGTFVMGSPYEEDYREANEGPQHKVTLSKPFYLGIYEVTQAQWAAVMGTYPSKFGYIPANPVEQVSWEDCQKFIAKLNTMGLGTFRLPTEAEWEYACRAGSTSTFYWGDDPEYSDIGQYAQIGEYYWYEEESYSLTTHFVGQKKPNAWGLYDMSGNVLEWCSDWYAASYGIDEAIDPKGPATGSERVLRGGGLVKDPELYRSAVRVFAEPTFTTPAIGFRLVRMVP